MRNSASNTLLANYVRKHTVVAMLGAAVMLILLQILFTYLGQVDRIKEGYGYIDALKYILTQSPRYLYGLLPMAALVGAVSGLGVLASSSELTVMRAAGVSLYRIVFWTVQAALVIAALALVLNQFVIPVTNPMGRAIKSPDSVSRIGELHGYWQRTGNHVIYVDYANKSGEAQQLKLWQLDDNARIVSLTDAQSANFSKQTKKWTLSGVTKLSLPQRSPAHYANKSGNAKPSSSHLDFNSVDQAASSVKVPFTGDTKKDIARFGEFGYVQKTTLAKLELNLPLEPSMIYLMTRSAEDLAISELYNYNQYMKAQGTPSAEHQLMFWQKLLSPLAVISLVIIACSFVFGSLRNHSMGLRLVVALLFGLLFNYAQELFGFMSLAYQAPPLYFVLMPILMSMAIGFYLLKRKR